MEEGMSGKGSEEKVNKSECKCIFIGNIAFGSTEEQIKEMCSECGTVVKIRNVIDNNTKKPKGYAFCEFSEAESAKNAIANLNGRTVNGRALRVGYADNNKINDYNTKVSNTKSNGNNNRSGNSNNNSAEITNNQLMERLNSTFKNDEKEESSMVMTDSIMAKLNKNFSTKEMYRIFCFFKDLSKNDPYQCRMMLTYNPLLSIVILHIHYLLGYITKPFLINPNLSIPFNQNGHQLNSSLSNFNSFNK